MFEHFTDRAKKVMALSKQEAQRFSNEYIETEHILLGLIKESRNSEESLFENLKIDAKNLRLEVEKLVKRNPDKEDIEKLPLTEHAQNVIRSTIEEARLLHDGNVRVGHILLGLFHETEGIASKVLTDTGLELEDIRRKLAKCPKACGKS